MNKPPKSSREIRHALLAAWAIHGLLWLPPAQAEPKEKADAAVLQTLRKAQGMLRQLNQEKTELEAQNADMRKQLGDLETQVRQLAPLAGEVSRQKAEIESLRGQNGALQQRVNAGTEQLHGLGEKYKSTQGTLQRYRQDDALLVGAVKERTEWIGQCSRKNRDLYQANRDLLAKFQGQGLWSSLAQAEPLTGIGQVERENEAENYRFRLEDLQITPWQEAKQDGSAAGTVPRAEGTVDEEVREDEESH